MSFTTDVRDELARVEPDCHHCEKATLAALVRTEGTLFMSARQKYRVEIATDCASVGRLIIKLIHSIYGLATELTVRRSVLHKTPNYLIEIPSQPDLAASLVDMGIIVPGAGLNMGIEPSVVAKQCCGAAYLRGCFLGCGFISDPKKDFHFEMTVESEDVANGLVGLMAEKNIHAKIMHRRNNYMVYLKNGDAILEFLAYVGAHRCACILEEARVVKSVRNDVNRAINAEMANEHKATKAALDQLINIRKVLESQEFETLSPALKEFIRLRITYPDLSLKELGDKADPKLSKSAINHRVRRLQEIAGKCGR